MLMILATEKPEIPVRPVIGLHNHFALCTLHKIVLYEAVAKAGPNC